MMASQRDREFKRIFEAANGLTTSDEFKAWFGGSKVVNGSGEPLVVYHGTSFKVRKSNPDKLLGDTWYTDDPDFANTFLGGRRKHSSTSPVTPVNGRIYPVFLKIERPVEYSKGSKLLTPEEFAEVIGVPFEDLDFEAKEIASKTLSPEDGWELATFGSGIVNLDIGNPVDFAKPFGIYFDNQNLREALKRRRFDGVITTEEGHRTFQVWDSSQVRSIWEASK